MSAPTTTGVAGNRRPTDDTDQGAAPEAPGSWRGVASENADDVPDAVGLRLKSRSRRLLGDLLAPYRRLVLVLTGVVLLENAARLSVPRLVQVGIDFGVPPLLSGGSARTLLQVLAVLLGAVVLQAVSRVVFLQVSGRVGQQVLLDLRRRVFRHFQRLDVAFHDRYTSGRVVSRQTNDVEAIQELLSNGFDGLVTAALTLVGTAVLLLTLDLRLGLACLVGFPVLLLLVRWFRNASEATYRTVRETAALVIVHFVETMTGIRAVQGYRRERRNQDIFEDVSGQYRVANERSFRLFAVFMPGVKLVGNLTTGMVLLYGGWLAYHDQMTVGVLTAFLLYLRQFFEPMQEISQFYNTFQSASSALEKLSGVLEEAPAVAEPRRPAGAAARAGRGGLRPGPVRLRPRPPGAARAGPRRARRPDRGAGRHDRRRQDHHRQADGPLPRPRSRASHPRRGRPPRPGRRHAAPARRDGDAGELHVRRHGGRQHPVRPPGGRPRGRGAGGPRRRRARVHQRAARRLRHRRRQAWRAAVGGAAAAGRVRPGVPGRPGRADPGRGDLQPRRPERAARAAGAADDPGRPHGADHRPPAEHGRDRRPGAGPRARTGARGRPPRELVDAGTGRYAALHQAWAASLA